MEPKYANHFQIFHSKDRDVFVLQFLSDFGQPVVLSEIVVSPRHLDRIITAIHENREKFMESKK